MYTKAAIALILLVGTMSGGLASPPQNRMLDALAEAMRAVTSQGLFAEEYEAILEAAQDDPQLRDKIVEHLVVSPK
jgi:Domain of unknown function (DUF4168)